MCANVVGYSRVGVLEGRSESVITGAAWHGTGGSGGRGAMPRRQGFLPLLPAASFPCSKFKLALAPHNASSSPFDHVLVTHL